MNWLLALEVTAKEPLVIEGKGQDNLAWKMLEEWELINPLLVTAKGKHLWGNPNHI